MPAKIINDELKAKVKELFDQEFGSRAIAKKLGISRPTVQTIYKELGITRDAGVIPTAFKVEEKLCKICELTKSVDEFRRRIRNGNISFSNYCLECERQDTSNRNSKRFKEDILYRTRTIISSSIRDYLTNNSSKKDGKSCLNYLEYSMEDLKIHLENQFEPWMTWENWGRYDPKIWDDNDQSTWTWNIDHIIPHSKFLYTSMDSDEFKKCWNLGNLRPLSSKINLLDGSKRLRHKAA